MAQDTPHRSTSPIQTRFFLLILVLSMTWIVYSVFHYDMFSRFLKDGGDGWGYYIYLPSAIISHDLPTLEYIARKRKEFNPSTINYDINHLGFGEVNIAPNGNPVIKYTCGVAMMLSPFFLTAHAISLVAGFPADGFSSLYWLSIYFGVILWVLLGMFLLYRMLIRYYDPIVAFGVLWVIALGTNLYYFLVYNAGMSHAPLLSLYCMLLYFTDSFYRKPKLVFGLAIGLICGLITMIRPVEIICIFIPLLWKIESFRERVNFLRKNYGILLVAVAGFCISILPQLLYWKISSGNWVFYSYGDEGFNFLKSRIWKGLTGYANGWFVYTPVMLFIFPGLYFLFRKQKGIFIPLAVFMVLHVYITFSWHNWYYINSFGSRPMVETYALMAIPLCAFLQAFMQSKLRWLLLVFGLYFIALNQLQTYQVSQAIMLSESGNKAYLRAIFGKTKMTERMLITSDTGERQPYRSELDSVGVIAWYDLEKDSAAVTEYGILLTRVSPQHHHAIEIIPEGDALRAGDFLRISLEGYSEGWNNDRWGMAAIICSFEREQKSYKWKWLRVNNKFGNPTWNLWGGVPSEWGEAWYFVEVPSEYRSGDRIRVWCENKHQATIVVRKFVVEWWRK